MVTYNRKRKCIVIFFFFYFISSGLYSSIRKVKTNNFQSNESDSYSHVIEFLTCNPNEFFFRKKRKLLSSSHHLPLLLFWFHILLLYQPLFFLILNSDFINFDLFFSFIFFRFLLPPQLCLAGYLSSDIAKGKRKYNKKKKP